MNPQVSIDLLEYEKDILRIDGSVDRAVAEAPAGFCVRVNGTAAGSFTQSIGRGNDAAKSKNEKDRVLLRFTGRFADVALREQTLTDRKAFVLELPVGALQEKNVIEFLWTSGKGALLPILTGGYQAKVCSALKNSYWCFGDYMVMLRRSGGGGRDALVIRRCGKRDRARQEMKLLREILLAPYGSRKMFGLRLMYWLARPFYSRKNIWITFDKLYKGGDCGEYFYKYMLERKEAGITPVYVIRRDAPDYGRLKKEGCRPAPYRALGQRLSYLYASMVFGTHSGVHSFLGLNNWEIQFLQDRLRAVNTCIQHGLSVQDLCADSHRCVNNNKRYYCASRNEIANLSGPEYDYALEVLRLTGIPRYDGLEDQSRRQILIAPTWRSYIAMPSAMGKTRPRNRDFKNTDYFKIYQSLLRNEELLQKAKDTGYGIVFLLHPVFSAQKEDFRTDADGGVRIVSALEYGYEKLLRESALMVTDYSGVQFDFAYMRKPVIYFHPPQLPPHYGEGGFAYESQGFGEISRDTEELVSLLCGYMDGGCSLKELYREREDAFFAFDDRENCKRIFEDAMAYQREAKRS